MIRELRIRNFQSHENTVLQFHPGVNVIVGPSDSGKSSILRSLRWVLFNKGGTGAFSHWSKKHMSTSVLLQGKEDITRSRSPKGNYYQIDDSELAAVGTAVPPAISEVLNVTELNMQRQGDPYFLLNDGPAEVARTLNAIAGLDAIDTAHTRISAKIRNQQANERDTNARLEEAKEGLKKYEGLDEIAGRYKVLEQEEHDVRFKRAQQTDMIELLETIEGAQEYCRRLGMVKVLEEDVEKTRTVFTNQMCTANTLASLVLLLDSAKRVEEIIAEYEDAPTEDEVSIVKAQISQQRQSANRVDELARIGAAINTCTFDQADCMRTLKQAEKEVEVLGVCPSCGAEPEHWRMK